MLWNVVNSTCLSVVTLTIEPIIQFPADVFDLRCDHIESPTGIITVTCSAESVLTAFTCTVDNKEPYNCE